METVPTLRVIAHIHTEFPQKFGLPRQSGLAPTRARIVMEPAYRQPEALRGIDGFSHIWLLWQFSESLRDTWSPTVRPPRLGGNTRMGVFATRSPFRPNAIGLSSVRLDAVEWETPNGPVLWVSGADLLDGTPLYDIKPYLAYTDARSRISSPICLRRRKLMMLRPKTMTISRAMMMAAAARNEMYWNIPAPGRL